MRATTRSLGTGTLLQHRARKRTPALQAAIANGDLIRIGPNYPGTQEDAAGWVTAYSNTEELLIHGYGGEGFYDDLLRGGASP